MSKANIDARLHTHTHTHTTQQMLGEGEYALG